MPQRPANPDIVQRWLAFLRNHKECIAAMDFFTDPTASMRVLYCWFVIHHKHRRIVHFNATFNPTAADREGRGDASGRRTPPPVRVAQSSLNA